MQTVRNECGDVFFKHLIGSRLIGNASLNSDIDWFMAHGVSLSMSMFDLGYSSLSIIPHTNYIDDSISFDMSTIIGALINPKNIHIMYLSKIISHLYAVKYELVSDIRNREIFDLYVDWLKTPGFAHTFWLTVKDIYWKYLDNIPDNECNWSQDFDGSTKHIDSRMVWNNLQVPYPTVNSNVGYDNLFAKRLFQDIFIIKSILLADTPISNMQKIFLNRVRNAEVNFDEYKSAKKVLWKQTRITLENFNHFYFLGSGYSIEESMQKKTLGVKGLYNLIDSCTTYVKFSQ
jgi:hypothetical protein